MTGDWSRVLPAFLLSRTCAAAPLLLHTMGSHRARSGVRLGVYLGDMGSQTIAMQLFKTVLAPNLFELTRPSVRILGAVVPLMLFNASGSVAPSAKLALRIFGRRRFHFPMGRDSVGSFHCALPPRRYAASRSMGYQRARTSRARKFKTTARRRSRPVNGYMKWRLRHPACVRT